MNKKTKCILFLIITIVIASSFYLLFTRESEHVETIIIKSISTEVRYEEDKAYYDVETTDGKRVFVQRLYEEYGSTGAKICDRSGCRNSEPIKYNHRFDKAVSPNQAYECKVTNVQSPINGQLCRRIETDPKNYDEYNDYDYTSSFSGAVLSKKSIVLDEKIGLDNRSCRDEDYGYDQTIWSHDDEEDYNEDEDASTYEGNCYITLVDQDGIKYDYPIYLLPIDYEDQGGKEDNRPHTLGEKFESLQIGKRYDIIFYDLDDRPVCAKKHEGQKAEPCASRNGVVIASEFDE